MSSAMGRPSSRATTIFCWFPPERLPAFTETLGVRMSNSRTSLSACSRTASTFRTPW